MKIVATDNLNRESVSERVVAENITSKEYAYEVALALNNKFCTSDDSPWYFNVQEDNYKPYKFEP